MSPNCNKFVLKELLSFTKLYVSNWLVPGPVTVLDNSIKTSMKSWLCLLACAQALVLSADAGVLLYEGFNYPDGAITTNSGGLWSAHSGGTIDAFVTGGKLQIDQSRREDVNRAFEIPNGDQYLYASFTLRMTELPTASGNYFAHFKDETTSNFLARVFAVTTNTVIPGTYRLGIANASGSTTNIFPMDLATNADYQVVVSYDNLNYISTLQVDPSSASDPSVVNSSVVSGSAAIAILSTYGFRQSTGEGVMAVDNLLVGNSFADVVTNTPSAPEFVVQPRGSTVYAGTEIRLVALARGGPPLTYRWRKDGADLFDGGNITGASSNILIIKGITAGQGGSYQAVVAGVGGPVPSQPAVVTVNEVPNMPLILTAPAGVTNSLGSTITLRVEAVGAGTLAYQWTFYGTNLAGANSNTLTLQNVSTTNSGPYAVVVSNLNGNTPSAMAYVSVPPPMRTTIAYLRTLVDSVTYLPTNSTWLYDVQGVVVTHTNMASTSNGQFYIMDETGGITLFARDNSTFRPKAGDLVRAVGPLEHFSSLLEIAPNANNPLHVAEVLASNQPMPNARLLDFAQSTNLSYMENVIEGSLVTLTNVYFTAADGTAAFSPNGNYTVTNAQGISIVVRIDSRVTSLNGIILPRFAYEVTGAMGQFLNGTATPRNTGYQLMITRPEDVVTVLPTALSLEVRRSEGGIQVSWPTQPGVVYTLQSSANLATGFAPYVSGFNSLTGTAQYTLTNTASQAQFFKVSVP